MKKLLALMVAAIFLVGCGADDPGSEELEEQQNVQYLWPYTVTLNDGTVVECVMTVNTSGLWCAPSEGDY